MDVQIVEDGLRAFIAKEICRALGEDYLDVYSPPPTANTVALLRYICDKWLGIFADSNTVANKRDFFIDAHRALKKHPHDPALNQRILAEIGSPGKAAAYKNKVDANAYGGTPRIPSNSNSSSTISKTSAYPNRSTPHTSVDADGDMTMGGGNEGRTNLSTSAITNSSSTYTHSSSSSSARRAFAAPPHAANGNSNCNINNGDSAMVDVELAGGTRSGGEIVVVLDGANIGWRYGRTKFSMIGVAASVAHYQRLMCRIIVVLPEGLSTPQQNTRREETEAINWINSLKDTSQLILTPTCDYDDAYVTHLARKLAAIIVSNDQFKDQIYQATADGKEAESGWKTYLTKCRCSFAFLGKSFVPNPAFDMKRAAAVARKYSLSPD